MQAPAGLWDRPAPHTLTRRVGPEDIDGLGHTNNAVYVTWCEEVAWDHSISLGMDLAGYRRLDRAMAVIHAEYDYLQASYLDDEVIAGTWITEWDRRLTMLRQMQIVRPADGVTLLRARVRFACIELSSGRPRRLPPEFIEVYGPAVLD